LGAFGCGVLKALAKNNIRLDIIAGTSIGGVNAAIIAGSKNKEHPEQLLEQFWLELSESFIDLDKLSSYPTFPKFIEQSLLPAYYYFPPLPKSESDSTSRKERNKNKAVKILLQLCYFWK